MQFNREIENIKWKFRATEHGLRSSNYTYSEFQKEIIGEAIF